MLRKERVLETLQLLCARQPAQSGVLRRYVGFSAEEVAVWAEVDRTNASRDLNLLAQEGKIERFPGRPVLFAVKTLFPEAGPLNETAGNGKQPDNQSGARKAFSRGADSAHAYLPLPSEPLPVPQEPGKPPVVAASVQVGAVVTSFETLIGSNEGLKVAIQQAKAAMLYPPRGLHTLLCGASGVGKTTFARLMHAYALELKALPADAPFISFNCADYASNPQLLMAHLFGVVRGAYTGADRDREGLVEQAHRGILFLDEVHRLPPEGQEMLFHLMDRERFRRLGEVTERSSSLLLLAATTAAGLAELANTLVGVNSVRWVELTLEQSPQELVNRVADLVCLADQGCGVLLLVDFASLLSLGELVTTQTGVQVRTVSGVSAPLIVEAVRRSQRPQHLTLDQLAANLTFSHTIDDCCKSDAGGSSNGKSVLSQEIQCKDGQVENDASFAATGTPRVILSVCLTGFAGPRQYSTTYQAAGCRNREQELLYHAIIIRNIYHIVSGFVPGSQLESVITRGVSLWVIVLRTGRPNPVLAHDQFGQLLQ